MIIIIIKIVKRISKFWISFDVEGENEDIIILLVLYVPSTRLVNFLSDPIFSGIFPLILFPSKF